MLTLLLAVGVVGCSGETGDGRPAPDEASADAGPDTRASDVRRMTGYLTVEPTPILTVCGTGEELALDGPAYADLLDLHGALAPGLEPLEGVFVDLLGTVVDDPRGRAIEAVEVRRAAWEGGGCGEPEPDLAFRASGTEPFWTLTVLGESLTWRTPDGQETLEHPGPYRSDRGDWLVDGGPTGEAGTAGASGRPEPTLNARFYAEPCRDAMSGAWFHMSAEVVFGGRDYRGCAYAGGESSP